MSSSNSEGRVRDRDTRGVFPGFRGDRHPSWRFVSGLLMAALLCCHAPRALAVPPRAVTDLVGSAHAAVMLELAALGVLSGYEDGTYRPESPVSRLEFAAMLVRALELPTDDLQKPPYRDVSSRHAWAYGALNAALKRGLIKGDSEGLLRPDAPITGGEAAAMLVRALGRDQLAAADPRGWPVNYINVARSLGIWRLAGLETTALSRGEAAEAIGASLNIEILTPSGDSRVDAGDTMLSRRGVRAVYASQALQTVSSGLAGRPAIRFPDGVVFPPDGEVDCVPLSDKVVYCGALSLEELLHKPVLVLLDKDNQVLFIAPMISGLVTEVVQSGDTWTLIIDGRRSYSATASIPVTMNQIRSTMDKVLPGSFVRLSFGLKGDVVAIDALTDVTGRLTVDGDSYLLTGADGVAWPISLNSHVKYFINRDPVDAETAARELERGTLAVATVSWDHQNWGIATVDVHLYDSVQTYRQPLIKVRVQHANYRDYYFVTDAADEKEHILAKDCPIWRNGTRSFFEDLAIGDRISFRTGASGEIVYLEAVADDNPPLADLPKRVCTMDRYSFAISKPVDPRSVKLLLDGRVCWPDNRGLDRYVVWYSPEDGMTHITIWPGLPFSTDGTHTVTIEALDYAGRKLQSAQEFCVDTTPISVASAEWAIFSAGTAKPATRVTIFFEAREGEALDTSSVFAKNSLVYLPGGRSDAGVGISACGATDYTVTIWLSGAAHPGGRICGQLRDNAGNLVPIDIIFNP